MRHNPKFGSRIEGSRRNRIRMATAALAIVLLASTFALARPAAADPTPVPAPGAPVVLAAPGGEPITQGAGCGASTVNCDESSKVSSGQPDQCSGLGAQCEQKSDPGPSLGTVAKTGACVLSPIACGVGIAAGDEIAGAVVDAAVEPFVRWVGEGFKGAAALVVHQVVVNLLGGDEKTSFRPDLSAPFFLKQHGTMVSIALLMIVPLLMLLVIQSIAKGSMLMLVRGMTIMLPIAILGTALMVFFTDLLLDIADNFSAALTQNYSKTAEFGTTLESSIQQLDPVKNGLFLVVCMAFLIIGGMLVMLELMLREASIYLSLFFMPLAFSGLVWPSTAKWAKRLIELLIALIFSKVFIAGAVALGVLAVANVNVDTLPANVPEEVQANAHFLNILRASAILFLAAISFKKVLEGTPSAMSAAGGGLADSKQILGKGQLLSLQMNKYLGKQAQKRANLLPTGAWKGKAGGKGIP